MHHRKGFVPMALSSRPWGYITHSYRKYLPNEQERRGVSRSLETILTAKSVNPSRGFATLPHQAESPEVKSGNGGTKYLGLIPSEVAGSAVSFSASPTANPVGRGKRNPGICAYMGST